MVKRRFLALLLASAVSLPAAAQSFPSRPIRLIIPYPAGGTTDVIARALQDPLAKKLGQPIVIDNRGGAAGSVGAREVARSEPDGYTILLSNDGPSIIAPLLQKGAGYDPVADFTPITFVSAQPLVLTVPSSVPANNLKEFLAWAEAQPSPVMYAAAGAGSLGHLSSEQFAKAAGIRVTHVPYRGSAPTTLAVMRGEVQMLLTTSSPQMDEYVKAGQLKMLARSARRKEDVPPGSPLVSDVIPDFRTDVWFGVLGPKGLPKPILDKLHAAFAEAIASPSVAEAYAVAGYKPATNSPAEFATVIADGVAKWKRVITESDIKVE